MKKTSLLAMFVLMIVTMAIVPQAFAKKVQVIRTPGGSNIESLGLVIDASYDPRLDTLVPGYKVINIVLINQSFSIVMLDPDKDKWEIKLAGGGKTVTALHNLRSSDPKAWSALPEKAKKLIGYPLALPIGAREVIDIFVPDKVDVAKFNQLDVYFRSINTKIEVLVSQ